jgi:hypothetical protein
MKNYLLKVENMLKVPKHIFQDNLTQYQGSKGHSATSDVTAISKFPFRIGLKLQVLSLLMTSTYWKGMIFNKASSSVSQSNVDALFLSLAASGILVIQSTPDGIIWMVGQDVPVLPQQHARVTFVEATIGRAKYTMDKYWMGINQHPPTRICVCTPLISVASKLSS